MVATIDFLLVKARFHLLVRNSKQSQDFKHSVPINTPIRSGFHMIIGDRSRGSFTIARIAGKFLSDCNNNMETKFSFCQRLPTIAGIESESNSAIMAIVNNPQRWQQVNGNHQCSDCSDCNDRNDPSDYMEIKAQESQ